MFFFAEFLASEWSCSLLLLVLPELDVLKREKIYYNIRIMILIRHKF
jgi:hypothetical protein